MTTTNIRYVDPNAEVGGDGTTNALTGDNCAYKSLAIWEAARQADLVSGDIIEKVICSSDDAGSTHLADTTACTIDGWTTDATRYIQIEAASSHGGKWNEAIYRLDGAPITYNERYIRMTCIQMTRAAGNCLGANLWGWTGEADWLLERLIVKQTSPNQYISGVSFSNANQSLQANIVIRNSLFYDWNGYRDNAIAIGASDSAIASIENCTFYGCYFAIRQSASSSVAATNCGRLGGREGGIAGTVAQVACSTATPTFVDADADDFHLAAGDTTWKNQGTDLSATFTDDIDGQTRPTGAGTWDIGCDEYVAALTGKPYYYFAQL